MKYTAEQRLDIGRQIYTGEISKEEALEMFKDDPYKLDLISRMDESEQVISCYSQGDFTDLCRGPHVDTVKELKYFKLIKKKYMDNCKFKTIVNVEKKGE